MGRGGWLLNNAQPGILQHRPKLEGIDQRMVVIGTKSDGLLFIVGFKNAQDVLARVAGGNGGIAPNWV
jgi:hypothetical protein